jgi:hypothetical protein
VKYLVYAVAALAIYLVSQVAPPETSASQWWGQDMWHLGAFCLLAVGAWKLGDWIETIGSKSKKSRK